MFLEWLLWTTLLTAIVVVTLLPIAVARYRGHPNTIPIVLVTLFFGWTLVGWVGALAWSFSSQEKK